MNIFFTHTLYITVFIIFTFFRFNVQFFFYIYSASVTVVALDEENESMKNKARHGCQVLALEKAQYDLFCQNGDIDLTEVNEGINTVADQRKRENRQNLVAGKAMTRLKSNRKGTYQIVKSDAVSNVAVILVRIVFY